jgi:hypothetical protein
MRTNEEMERRLNLLSENQIVQGELLSRIEQGQARNTEAIAGTTAAVGKLTDGMVILQAAMERLSGHMDRFIRGLESNGRKN